MRSVQTSATGISANGSSLLLITDHNAPNAIYAFVYEYLIDVEFRHSLPIGGRTNIVGLQTYVGRREPQIPRLRNIGGLRS